MKDSKTVNSKTLTINILKNRKFEIFLKVLTSVVVRGLLLLTPILYSKAIDFIPNGEYNLAFKYLGWALVVTIVYYIFNQLNEIAYYNLYNKLYNQYVWSIIKTTNSNSAYSLSRFTLGEYSNMLYSDLNIIVDFLSTLIIRIVKVLEFLVIYAYFFSLDKIVFLISIAITIVALVIEFSRGSKVEYYNLNRKRELDNYISTVNDTFLGMKEIKSLHILDKVKNKINSASSNYLKEHKNYNNFYTEGKYFILCLIDMMRYILIIYGVYLISIGQFQLGSIVLIYNYYQKMVDNFGEICSMNLEFRNFKVSLRRLNKIFEFCNSKCDYKVTQFDKIEGGIVFNKVLYGDRKDPILKKVSFEINPNSITVITGKIGSGKSGIFDLLMRINRQHEGSITINGINIDDIDDNIYYDVVSLVRKTPTFFEMSIMDNLKLISDNEVKIIDVCQMLGIDKQITNLTNGYDTSLNSREVNTELREMLGIARIFIKDTPIMLFDEIIDTLDDSNKEIVLNILKKLQNNHTIVIISRSVDMLSFGDRLITMDRNTIKKIDDIK